MKPVAITTSYRFVVLIATFRKGHYLQANGHRVTVVSLSESLISGLQQLHAGLILLTHRARLVQNRRMQPATVPLINGVIWQSKFGTNSTASRGSTGDPRLDPAGGLPCPRPPLICSPVDKFLATPLIELTAGSGRPVTSNCR